MICKNCQGNFEGNFCNNCGQSSLVSKISLSYLIDELTNSVLQVNRGIFFTIKELLIRPGNSIREFLEGKRKKHFKPLAFVLLISTIYVLLTSLTGTKTHLGDGLSGMADALSRPDLKLFKLPNILKWLANNHAFSTLILLPIFSLASYLSFIKRKFNYYEHLILQLYIAGQQMIVYIFFTLLIYLSKDSGYFLQILALLFSSLYTFWVIVQFFQYKKVLITILLVILTYIIYYFLCVVILVPIGILEAIEIF